MRTVNTVQRGDHEKAAQVIRKAREELETAVEKFNATMPESLTRIKAALDKLKTGLSGAADWCDGISVEMEQCADDLSKRWLESEAGQNFSLWKDQLLGLFLDEIEMEKVDDLGVPAWFAPVEILVLPDQPG